MIDAARRAPTACRAILPAMANAALALSLLGYSEDAPAARARRSRAPRRPAARATRRRAAHAAVPVARLGHGAGRPRARAGGRARRTIPALGARRRRGCSASRPTGRATGRGATPRRPAAGTSSTATSSIPDVDDTCMALMVLRAGARRRHAEATQAAAIARGLAWMLGMQNRRRRLGQLRSRQRQAWLTARPVRRPQRDDRSQHRRHHRPRARVPGPLPAASTRATRSSRARCGFLRRDQTTDGCLVRPLGRQLRLRHLAGAARPGVHRRGHERAATCAAPSRWLLAHQNRDGGWGESIASYDRPRRRRASAPRRPARPPGRSWASSPRARSAAPPSGAAFATCWNARTPPGPGAKRRGPAPGFPRSSTSATSSTGTLPADGARPVPARHRDVRAAWAERSAVKPRGELVMEPPFATEGAHQISLRADQSLSDSTAAPAKASEARFPISAATDRSGRRTRRASPRPSRRTPAVGSPR